MDKFYGCGVVDKAGDRQSELVMDLVGAERIAGGLNKYEGTWTARGPFRVVQLFYKEITG